MDIYEIKRLTSKTEPYFFSRKTMKFFGQTLKDFKVKKQSDGRYLIKAPCYNIKITYLENTYKTGYHITKRYFNPVNNKLEF